MALSGFGVLAVVLAFGAAIWLAGALSIKAIDCLQRRSGTGRSVRR